MNKSKYIILPAVALTMMLGSASTAFAEQDEQKNGQGRGQDSREEMQRDADRGDRDKSARPLNHRVGEITAIDGTTLTVKLTSPDYITKTLRVDVSKATFEKITFDAAATTTKPTPVSQTLSDLAVGETVGIKVDGKVTEEMTSVVASLITEIAGDKPERPASEDDTRNVPSKKAFLREGKRGIVGEVTNVGSTTLTVKAMNGTTYTVDTSDAEVKSGTTTETLSNIAEGDRIAVRGEIDDSTIDAVMILTDIPTAPANKNASETGKERSFFGKVGSFFGKLFGKKAE